MEKVGRSKHADLSISETFQNIGEIVYHMQTPTFWAYRPVSVPRLSRRFSFSLSSWIGCLSHGVKEIPVPLTELTVVHFSLQISAASLSSDIPDRVTPLNLKH